MYIPERTIYDCGAFSQKISIINRETYILFFFPPLRGGKKIGQDRVLTYSASFWDALSCVVTEGCQSAE